jgi:hypothetical protein
VGFRPLHRPLPPPVLDDRVEGLDAGRLTAEPVELGPVGSQLSLQIVEYMLFGSPSGLASV